jgi:hypothetical protein
MSTAQITRNQNKCKVKLNETEKVVAVHRRIKEFFVTKLIQDRHDGGSHKLLQLKKYKELSVDKVNHLYVISHKMLRKTRGNLVTKRAGTPFWKLLIRRTKAGTAFRNLFLLPNSAA